MIKTLMIRQPPRIPATMPTIAPVPSLEEVLEEEVVGAQTKQLARPESGHQEKNSWRRR